MAERKLPDELWFPFDPETGQFRTADAGRTRDYCQSLCRSSEVPVNVLAAARAQGVIEMARRVAGELHVASSYMELQAAACMTTIKAVPLRTQLSVGQDGRCERLMAKKTKHLPMSGYLGVAVKKILDAYAEAGGQEKPLSRRTIAKQVGISFVQVSRVDTGAMIPSISYIDKVERLTGQDVYRLAADLRRLDRESRR